MLVSILNDKMKVSLREFNKNDIPALAAWRAGIRGEQYMSNYRPKDADAHAPAQSVCWYVIQADGRDVGTVWLDWAGSPDSASLGIFLGEEALFGRGLGTGAISAAIAAARQYGPPAKVRLNVREGNARAIACYAKCGFAVVSRGTKCNPAGETIRCITMELDL